MHEGGDEFAWLIGSGPEEVGLDLPCVLHGLARARTVHEGPWRLVVIGECAATSADLRAALGAVASGRWAELTGWSGSYWVVADRPGERLVCGDLAGLRGVFYTVADDGLVRWASRPHPLAAQVGAPADLELLSARIVVGEQHLSGWSPFTGVRAVPGGYGLLLPARGAVRLVDVTAPLEPVGLWEGAGRFGEALEQAIGMRMGSGAGAVGADLSGGLDSSTAVLLASRWGEVRAVTYTDAFTSAEDTAFAARVANYAGLTHRTVVGTEAELPFGFPCGAPAGDEPVLDAANTSMDAAYLAPVAGLRAHLTGHGGDVVLDSSSACFPGMVQAGERRRAHRQVVAWSRHRNIAPRPVWKGVKRAAGGYRSALEEAAATLEAGRVSPHRAGSAWTWLRLGSAAAWLTADGRASVAELLRQRTDSAEEVRAEEFDQWAALRATGSCARAAAPVYVALGIRPAHPFLDNQVVRAAFATSAFERHSTVTYKPLLAAALPQLPLWLTSRRSKGAFTAQRIAGLARHVSRLRHLIRDSALVSNGLVDAELAVGALESAARGERAAGLAELHQLLVTCHWLKSQPTVAPTGEQGAAA